ncbi:MAG TPA: circularly permuted type 2 ATP-grasp protein [Acidimicrobiales bacterium]|nr:circularly permuted type 2 ATP-grasp protein [Acidimicrobiales bacterium]
MTIAEREQRERQRRRSRRRGWDEMLDHDGEPRQGAGALVEHLRGLGLSELQARQDAADLDILGMGITFTVYSDGRGIDRAWPFDVIPRVIDATEWRHIEAGLKQRLTALNRFIDDIYNDQQVVADGVFPAHLLEGSLNYRPECRGARPAYGIWAHICGSDLVRDADGTVYVLEDNLRVPSGVSYLLENRLVSKRAFADLFAHQSIQPVDDYPDELFGLLASLAPDVAEPTVAVLTPGLHNSAYFEHSFLAQRMGLPLVEGRDLFVAPDDHLYARTIAGPQRVDVLYRRVDDRYLDPEVFEPTSLLGVPGLLRSWQAGHVAIANAPGAGVADDKVVYAWVPDLIRYYLDEEPLLPNVPTYRCCYADERDHVLANLRDLVVKPADESGGYGLVIGNQASDEDLALVGAAIEASPRRWVAQPILSLSTVPTLCDGKIEDRHVDLRPFILTGRRSYVTRGGLTRVALQEGSLVVNSSQGGGSKDTWVVEDCTPPAAAGA